MRTGHVTFICYCLMVFEFMRFVCGHHSTWFWSREGITRSINKKIPLRSNIRNRSTFIDRPKTDRFAFSCRVSIPEFVRLINNRRRIRDRQRNISMIFQSINILSSEIFSQNPKPWARDSKARISPLLFRSFAQHPRTKMFNNFRSNHWSWIGYWDQGGWTLVHGIQVVSFL